MIARGTGRTSLGDGAQRTTTDALFAQVEAWQADQPWGSVLDAGTGAHSLQWIQSLETARWTAVTGTPGRAKALRDQTASTRRTQDRIEVGDWADASFLEGESFDTVIADYLLGALDGFAPYFQDRLFARLRPRVGQRLVVLGQEPHPATAATPGARALLELCRTRDACILLAGHRCYREYPLDWVIRHLEAAGFRVEATQRFSIRYGVRFVEGQLRVGLDKLPFLQDAALGFAMRRRLDALREVLMPLAEAGIALGSDYVVSAVPMSEAR